MGKYESYSNDILRATFGDRFSTDDTVFSFGPDAGTGEIDGIIDGRIAVEIAGGSPKQVRASVLELIFHPYEGKFLIVIDRRGHSTERALVQAATILGRSGCSGVVVRLPNVDEAVDVGAYRDDLIAVVDKYVGETEKNLIRMFDMVDGSDAALSFDEADGLFGKRTDLRR